MAKKTFSMPVWAAAFERPLQDRRSGIETPSPQLHAKAKVSGIVSRSSREFFT
jgi:hypothetical protein